MYRPTVVDQPPESVSAKLPFMLYLPGKLQGRAVKGHSVPLMALSSIELTEGPLYACVVHKAA